MKKQLHPALELFRREFERVAANPPPESPTHYVPRDVFTAKLREAGIEFPRDWPAMLKWEEDIGLTEFVHKLIAAHHKKHGSDFSPMEKASWRMVEETEMTRIREMLL